jgi:hypothetical protein
MALQERTLGSELVHSSGGVFDQVARAALLLPRSEHRDSLGPFAVEVAPIGDPPRIRIAWTMAAIGAVAMAFILAAHAKKAPTASPHAVGPAAPLVAPVTVSRESPPL